MPAAIAGMIAIGLFEAGVFGALGFGAAIFTANVISAAIGLGISFAISAAARSLEKKPRSESPADTGRSVTIREPIAPRRVTYGCVRAGGVITFVGQSTWAGGPPNGFLHLVVTLSGHEMQQVGDLYFGGTLVPIDAATKLASNARYINVAYLDKNLGTATQTAFADLVTAGVGWTTDHRQLDCAGSYLRLSWSSWYYPTGVPLIVFDFKGKKVYDPRTATTVFSNNAALCLSDYLTDAQLGKGLDYATQIDEDLLIAAANICDEFVDVVNASDEFIYQPTHGANFLARPTFNCQWRLGDRVQVSTTGTLPGGLAPSTNYYVIPVIQHSLFSAIENEDFQLASSLVNARAGTAVTITSAGSGVHTVTRFAEPRYTCDGTYLTSQKPEEIIGELLTAMRGTVFKVGPLWKIYAGAWRTPTITLDEDDLRAPIVVTSRVSRRENFNRVKGSYVSPWHEWQPTDFPPVTNATYLTEDNNFPAWLDVRYPYTTSGSAAQRLAKMELEIMRQQITCVYPSKLSAFRLQRGDTVLVDNTRMGWSAKGFEVAYLQFVQEGEPPYFGVDLVLRETASAVYDWNSGEETTVDPAPDTNLPDPFVVVDPTGLTLSSGTVVLDVRRDGTVFSRIKANWTAPDDAFVQSGGHIEIQAKRSSVGTWRQSFSVPGDQVEAYILDVQDNVAYDVRIRSVNNLGGLGNWVSVTNHTVIGKTAEPSDVESISAFFDLEGEIVILTWIPITDVDLAGYEIRYGTTDTFIWANGRILNSRATGNNMTTNILPPGNLSIGIKAFDTSGNYSVNAAVTTILISQPRWVLEVHSIGPAQRLAIHPEIDPWSDGTILNFVHHKPTDYLIPDSTVLVSDLGGDIFDEWLPSAVASAQFTSLPIALTGSPAAFPSQEVPDRIWGIIEFGVGPGEVGIGQNRIEVRFKDDVVGVWSDWYEWSIGEVLGSVIAPQNPSAAMAQARVTLYTTISGGSGDQLWVIPAKGFLKRLDFNQDHKTHNESGVIVSGAAPVGEFSVTFTKQFAQIPRVVLSYESAGTYITRIDSASVNRAGFTGIIVDTSGVGISGVTVHWMASDLF